MSVTRRVRVRARVRVRVRVRVSFGVRFRVRVRLPDPPDHISDAVGGGASAARASNRLNTISTSKC